MVQFKQTLNALKVRKSTGKPLALPIVDSEPEARRFLYTNHAPGLSLHTPESKAFRTPSNPNPSTLLSTCLSTWTAGGLPTVHPPYRGGRGQKSTTGSTRNMKANP